MATALKSIRAPLEVWRGLESLALSRGENVNAFVVRLMTEALDGSDFAPVEPPRPPPTAPRSATVIATSRRPPPAAPKADARRVLEEAEERAAHLARPRPKAGQKATDDDNGYTPAGWGENRAAPGSRLKGAPKLR